MSNGKAYILYNVTQRLTVGRYETVELAMARLERAPWDEWEVYRHGDVMLKYVPEAAK